MPGKAGPRVTVFVLFALLPQPLIALTLNVPESMKLAGYTTVTLNAVVVYGGGCPLNKIFGKNLQTSQGKLLKNNLI